MACKCLSTNPLLNKWESSRQQLLLSWTAQSREPSLPKSLTQYQAEKALLLRTRLRRVKLLKCEILLELLNDHTGDWSQQLGVHPQIHILPAFKQETFPGPSKQHYVSSLFCWILVYCCSNLQSIFSDLLKRIEHTGNHLISSSLPKEFNSLYHPLLWKMISEPGFPLQAITKDAWPVSLWKA